MGFCGVHGAFLPISAAEALVDMDRFVLVYLVYLGQLKFYYGVNFHWILFSFVEDET